MSISVLTVREHLAKFYFRSFIMLSDWLKKKKKRKQEKQNSASTEMSFFKEFRVTEMTLTTFAHRDDFYKKLLPYIFLKILIILVGLAVIHMMPKHPKIWYKTILVFRIHLLSSSVFTQNIQYKLILY